jgi:hypothetical protein
MQNPIVYLNSVLGLALGGRNHNPETVLHRTELWSGHATLAILAGIILEILVTLGFVPRSTEWAKGYAVVADILIGVGLIIEYICIRAAIVASAEQKRESDAKLAEALDRAATAQRELVKFRTPRRSLMPAIAKQEVADKLRAFAETPFDVGFGDGDGEQADCAWDLEEILAKAGWNQLPWGVHAVGISVILRNLRPVAGSVGAQNVEIQMEQESRQARLAAAEALVAALNAIGIEAKETPYNTPNNNVHAIHVLIGPKR